MARKKQRRSYGIGRKFRRGRLWWVAVYDGAGVEIRRPTHSTKEADADDLLGQLLRERSRGDLVAINSPEVFTIADVLDDYLKRREKLAPGTLATYRSQTETLLIPFFGLLAPAKLTTDMLSDYRDHRAKEEVRHHNGGLEGSSKRLSRKVSPTSVNRELGLLRSALRDLAKRRPAVLPTLPYFPMESERGNARQGFLSEKTFAEKLFPELPRHLQALSACAFYCGGRRSEWLRVDWAEVDFERMVIRFIKTKNKNPREVPIVRGLMLTSLLEALKLRDAVWPEQSAAFCYNGQRMSTVGDAWDKACARARCEGLLFHDLRRSANKNMRDRGISQGVRMKIMGHLTPSMDIRYGIVDVEDIADAGEKLGQARPKRLTRVK